MKAKQFLKIGLLSLGGNKQWQKTLSFLKKHVH